MNRYASHVALLIPIAIGLYLLLTSTTEMFPAFWLYDVKRMLQLFLLLGMLLLAVFHAPIRIAMTGLLQRIPPWMAGALTAVVVLGLVSALYNAESLMHGAYSVSEVSLLSVCVCAALTVAAARHVAASMFDRFAMAALLMLSLAVGTQELMGAAAAWSGGTEFNFRVSLLHFSWPRFYNQVQSWVVPVLTAAPALFGKTTLVRILTVLSIGLHWYVILLTGGRGSVVSLLTVFFLFFLAFPSIRRDLLTWQVSGVALGALVYSLVLFSFSPPFSGETSQMGGQYGNGPAKEITPADTSQPTSATKGSFIQQSIGRPIMNTSGRLDLWKISLQQVRSQPVLGAGPMSYACKGARFQPGHPHNFPLQLAGEWGLLATAIVLFIVLYFASKSFALLRSSYPRSHRENILLTMLAAGICSASLHACLSGVFVMPASQSSGILICGWYLGLLISPERRAAGIDRLRFGSGSGPWLVPILATAVLSVLIVFSSYELARSEETQERTPPISQGFPRYWQNGKVCGLYLAGTAHGINDKNP